MQGNVLGAGLKAKRRPCAQGELVVEVIKYIYVYCTRQNMISAIRAKTCCVSSDYRESVLAIGNRNVVFIKRVTWALDLMSKLRGFHLKDLGNTLGKEKGTVMMRRRE